MICINNINHMIKENKNYKFFVYTRKITFIVGVLNALIFLH